MKKLQKFVRYMLYTGKLESDYRLVFHKDRIEMFREHNFSKAKFDIPGGDLDGFCISLGNFMDIDLDDMVVSDCKESVMYEKDDAIIKVKNTHIPKEEPLSYNFVGVCGIEIGFIQKAIENGEMLPRLQGMFLCPKGVTLTNVVKNEMPIKSYEGALRYDEQIGMIDTQGLIGTLLFGDHSRETAQVSVDFKAGVCLIKTEHVELVTNLHTKKMKRSFKAMNEMCPAYKISFNPNVLWDVLDKSRMITCSIGDDYVEFEEYEGEVSVIVNTPKQNAHNVFFSIPFHLVEKYGDGIAYNKNTVGFICGDYIYIL